MGGPAEGKPVGEEAQPIISVGLPIGEAFTEAVAGAVFPVGVVEVAPVPGGQSLVLVGVYGAAGDAMVEGRLGSEEPLERGARQLAWIPRVVRLHLRIARRRPNGAGGEKDGQHEQA